MQKVLYPVFLHLVLVALAATSLALANQNRHLAASLGPSESQLEIGTKAEPVEVLSLDGKVQTLPGEPSRSRLLLAFTTSCPACQQNQQGWRWLHETVGPEVEVVAVSLDSVEATLAYREANDLTFEVVVAANRDAFTTSYEISSVPTTLLIDHEGRVQGIWQGTLSSAQLKAVAAKVPTT